MPKGNLADMIDAFESRIDELSSGLIDSAEKLKISERNSCDTKQEPVLGFIDDELTDIDNIVGWLQEHETAYEDFNLYFQDVPEEDITLDKVIGWISDHDTLCRDFCNRFPELAEEHELMCCANSSTITASSAASPEFVEKFCWEINDAVIGSAVDCDSVECSFNNQSFEISVTMEDGTVEEFNVPLSDLSCDVDTLDDDIDYVVSEIEAAFL